MTDGGETAVGCDGDGRWFLRKGHLKILPAVRIGDVELMGIGRNHDEAI
jgi:hypothetical protein